MKRQPSPKNFSFLPENILSLIFDKDGTLVLVENDRPPNTPQSQKYLTDVKLNHTLLFQSSYAKAVATNQGGVAFGFITEADAITCTMNAAAEIGANHYALCCVHPTATIKRYRRDSKFRKPNPGMLLYLMDILGYGPEYTLYIGDGVEDELAAKGAKCPFMWAEHFWESMAHERGLWNLE